MRKAVEIAKTYSLVIEPDAELGYLGRTIEMPYAMSDGRTIDRCAAQVLDATASAIAVLLESGERPPSPARELKRDQQLNVRLTAEEKMNLDEAARQAGFRSVSDFVRTAALDRSRRRAD